MCGFTWKSHLIWIFERSSVLSTRSRFRGQCQKIYTFQSEAQTNRDGSLLKKMLKLNKNLLNIKFKRKIILFTFPAEILFAMFFFFIARFVFQHNFPFLLLPHLLSKFTRAVAFNTIFHHENSLTPFVYISTRNFSSFFYFQSKRNIFFFFCTQTIWEIWHCKIELNQAADESKRKMQTTFIMQLLCFACHLKEIQFREFLLLLPWNLKW